MVITGLTRNQLCLRAPWVRIPPSPPKKETPKRAFFLNQNGGIRRRAISKQSCGLFTARALCKQIQLHTLNKTGCVFSPKYKFPPSPPKKETPKRAFFFFCTFFFIAFMIQYIYNSYRVVILLCLTEKSLFF